jgi:hypothetical protein
LQDFISAASRPAEEVFSMKKTKRVTLPLPGLGAIAATRGMLGLGAGLLLSRRIPRRRRQALGWALLGIGAASTIPLAVMALRA